MGGLVSLGPVKSGLGMVGILEATTLGPRSTHELVQALNALGLDVTGPELYPWLRRLTQENLLTPSLQIDPSGAQTRHYWIPREGARVLEQCLPVLRALGNVEGKPH